MPTPDEQERLGNLPTFVQGGPHNPLGARALYLYEGNKDTLFRIHGTNQPEYIGSGDLVGLHPLDQRGRRSTSTTASRSAAPWWCWRPDTATRRSTRGWP